MHDQTHFLQVPEVVVFWGFLSFFFPSGQKKPKQTQNKKPKHPPHHPISVNFFVNM